MHEKLKEVTHNMEGCWLGKGGVEDEIESSFLSQGCEGTGLPQKVGVAREYCVSLEVDTKQSLRMCEGRQAEVDVIEVSYVSWDRVDDQWPS